MQSGDSLAMRGARTLDAADLPQPPEHIVKIPLSRLQQLVELYARVVRESREVQPPRDLERDAEARHVANVSRPYSDLYSLWEVSCCANQLASLPEFRKRSSATYAIMYCPG